jgi:7-cyano-7-deazaguanine synthase
MTDIPDSRPPVDSVAIVSGGMDSVTLLYAMKTLGYQPRVLSFNYGQRHKKELEFAKYHATALDLPWHCIDLSGITHLINNSALTSQTRMVTGTELAEGKGFHNHIEVPEGHYADDNMKLTVVPNRNMMMLSIAGAVVVNDRALTLGIGVHGGDHAIYPDCRPEFIEQFEETLKAANVGFIQRNFRMFAPFLYEDKAYIVESGEELNVDWTKTWSCYKGGEVHCGKCATCVERREAFALAGVVDPTEYEDKTNYWKQVTQNA